MQTGNDRADRPGASWVMGRSARWHDPAFLDALEKAGAAEAATRTAGFLGGPTVVGLFGLRGPIARLGMTVLLVRRLLWARGRAPHPPAGG